jgi:hypothetical protein
MRRICSVLFSEGGGHCRTVDQMPIHALAKANGPVDDRFIVMVSAFSGDRDEGDDDMAVKNGMDEIGSYNSPRCFVVNTHSGTFVLS